MTRLVELDPDVPFHRQLGDAGGGPVVLVNVFHVAAADADAFVAGWRESARILEAQDGFVSTRLHRGIAGSTTFLNHAVWRDVAAYRAAIGRPEVQASIRRDAGDVTSSPHLFRPVDDGPPGA